MKSDHNGLETMRHSAAHVMAAAVRRLWPDALFDIGPDTDDGFYYDFDLKHRLTAEDFPAIEAEMAKYPCYGRITSGAGGGYLVLITDEEVPGGLRIKVRRRGTGRRSRTIPAG